MRRTHRRRRRSLRGATTPRLSPGNFPWFSEGTDILWWSPDPRTIIEMDWVHLSRSLKRRLVRGEFVFTRDKCFFDVMRACGDRPEGTWILPSMLAAYEALHRLGHAHSFEVWQDGALVGGLYGVCIGRAFAAESTFHRVTDASKAALVLAVRSLRRLGIVLFDVQYLTSHLSSMGANVIPRDSYLERLDDAQRGNVEFANLVLDYEE
ncbi:MAG: leucyl/phenylalanyl-tRNA--protein transferase [Polyangiaceae bacterium]